MIIAMQQTQFNKNALKINPNNSNLFSELYIAFEVEMRYAENIRI
jgi:hypothetical protein